MSVTTAWTELVGGKAPTGIALIAAGFAVTGAVVLVEPSWRPPTRTLPFHVLFLLGLPAVLIGSGVALGRRESSAVVGTWSFTGYLCMVLLAVVVTTSQLMLTQHAGLTLPPLHEGQLILRNANVGGIFGFIAGASYGQLAHARQLQAELQRRNDQLEAFAGIIAHDLRNPLNVASGRTELAMHECESDHLEAVERAHDRMESLIETLLVLARMGERIEEFEPVRLDTVVRNARRHVETDRVTVTVTTEKTISADRSRLMQLFENLFRNAVDHTDGHTTVTVGAVDTGFYVEDDGPGIPEEIREDVFEGGYSTAESGTGLGLFIVKEIVEAHGWEVAVTDGTDGGARFEITGVASATGS